ncbi:MAG: hypothetical protein AB7G75_34115 [Candidatus Binatia bacterium]
MPPAFGDATESRFTYNLGVPLDQLDHSSPLCEAYSRVSFRAWQLSDGMRQGIELKTVLSWIGALKDQPVPQENLRLVQLCTEAGAAVMACRASLDLTPGMYGLIDIGAWTTDISFFRHVALKVTNDGLSSIEFYAAGTYRVAVNEVDERTLRGLFELWDLQQSEQQERRPPLCVATVRVQRETQQFGMEWFEIEKRQRTPTNATLQFARECVRERVLDGVLKTLRQAREKERSASAFQGLRIFVIGGGSRERILWEDIQREIPLVQSIEVLPLLQFESPVPADVAQRLTIAAGLAVPLALWDRIFLPSQVEPVRPRPARDWITFGYEDT